MLTGPFSRCDLFPKRLDIVESRGDLVLPARWASGMIRDRAAVAGDDDGLAALDLVEKLGEAGFCLQGLNFTHRMVPIGQSDQSRRIGNDGQPGRG